MYISWNTDHPRKQHQCDLHYFLKYKYIAKGLYILLGKQRVESAKLIRLVSLVLLEKKTERNSKKIGQV